MKTEWKVIKKETAELHLTEHTTFLLTDNEKLKGVHKDAEAFSSFLSNSCSEFKFTSWRGKRAPASF
jgi:hypothetical protein